MKPFFQDDSITLYQGDSLACLRELQADSVQCCVTSPPYWGLRDYGTAEWEAGDAVCDHKQAFEHQKQGATSARAGRSNAEAQRNENFRDVCGKCGARRIDQQIGLERTPEEYVARLVEVFREVRRVLKPDGTLWLNLGDSYARNGGEPGGGNRELMHMEGKQRRMKPKDLVGIPWRVAFALQADGWYLRSDIIWHKPNPMPESVTDRPTKSHEYLFLMAKSEKYYYNAEAIAERVAPSQIGRVRADPVGGASHAERGQHSPGGVYATNGKHAATDPQAPGRRMVENVARARAKGADHDSPFGGTRNKRSVWTINTAPFPEAHFATFPEDLVTPCILAGARHGDTVLDPFSGAATVAVVARRNQCKFIGIELNPEYCEMSARRLRQNVLELASNRRER